MDYIKFIHQDNGDITIEANGNRIKMIQAIANCMLNDKAVEEIILGSVIAFNEFKANKG